LPQQKYLKFAINRSGDWLVSQSVSVGGCVCFGTVLVIRELHLVGVVGAAAQPIAGKPAPTPIVVALGDL